MRKQALSRRWVVNASPLIALCKVGRQGLIFNLADAVVIPQAVVDEINAGPQNDPARRFLLEGPAPIAAVAPHPSVVTWDLGAGETAVLSYAYAHPGWTAIIDDGAARRCGKALGVPLNGTLGIIIGARRAGLIAAAAPILKDLQSEGFRLRDDVIEAALHTIVGETWT